MFVTEFCPGVESDVRMHDLGYVVVEEEEVFLMQVCGVTSVEKRVIFREIVMKFGVSEGVTGTIEKGNLNREI